MREKKLAYTTTYFCVSIFLNYFSGDRGKFCFSILKSNKKRRFSNYSAFFQLIHSLRYQFSLTDNRGSQRWPHLHIRQLSYGCQVTWAHASQTFAVSSLQPVPRTTVQYLLCFHQANSTNPLSCSLGPLKSTECSTSLAVHLALHIPGSNTDAEN